MDQLDVYPNPNPRTRDFAVSGLQGQAISTNPPVTPK
jgi:hypothetical protein